MSAAILQHSAFLCRDVRNQKMLDENAVFRENRYREKWQEHMYNIRTENFVKFGHTVCEIFKRTKIHDSRSIIIHVY